jgi:hypothetical protein
MCGVGERSRRVCYYGAMSQRDVVGEPPPERGRVRTLHWFDPCELLVPEARSERKREHGNDGRWVAPATSEIPAGDSGPCSFYGQ